VLTLGLTGLYDTISLITPFKSNVSYTGIKYHHLIHGFHLVSNQIDLSAFITSYYRLPSTLLFTGNICLLFYTTPSSCIRRRLPFFPSGFECHGPEHMTRHFIVDNIHPALSNSSSFNLPLLLFHQLPSACSHTSSPNLYCSSSWSFHLQHLLLYMSAWRMTCSGG
jgi:hypothetical protein